MQSANTLPTITSATDAATSNQPRREDELVRLFADALKDSVGELRKDEEARISRFTAAFQGGISALREGEETRIARLEWAIKNWKPESTEADPATNFWTVYKKAADEHDDDMASKYLGDLDTSLLFAGLFSAVTSAFIVQIIPQLQPDPTDLTNVLLLRILQQNTSFGGSDPLMPIRNVPAGAVRAQSILFVCLSVTLFAAFIAVLGKQWIVYYTRVATLGSIVDRGKERQAKFAGFQKWGVHVIMESLPVMLQFVLLLFGVALAVYLWDLNFSAAEAVLAVTSVGLAFYTCITILATIHNDCPFQTPLSILLPKIPMWWKDFAAFVRVRWRRSTTSFRLHVERATEHGFLKSSVQRTLRIHTSGTSTPNHPVRDTPHDGYHMTLSNPTFWRSSPLFTSPIPENIITSAGIWLLENSTDSSAASAVAAVFSDFQLPPRYCSTTALIRLRDAYEECFQAPEFKKPARLRALQSAVAYYVLYHTQLVWYTSNQIRGEVEELPVDLPPDLFLHRHRDKWDGDDVFEHLLRTKDCSDSMKSMRLLSYIAPYWFCGDSDSSVWSRPNRLQTLYELIEVLEEALTKSPALAKSQALENEGLERSQAITKEALERSHEEALERSPVSESKELKKSQALEKAALEESQVLEREALKESQASKKYRPLDPAALTDCLLCAGAAMDFPLHPEDLIRADKSDYVGQTFKLVVEYVHGLILTRSRRRRHTKTALEILLTLDRKTTLSLVDAPWVNGLLKSASRGNMGDGMFTLFLRLSARRKEEDFVVDTESPAGQDHIHIQPGEIDPQSPSGIVSPEIITPEHSLFIKILQNIQACGEKNNGWQDEAVYGGLIAMKDIPRLGTFFPDSDSLGTLFKAMDWSRPFRVRKAAYDVVLVAREGWLRSAHLRPVLEERDFPRRLHSVVIETGRSDYQRSFLMMMEILSEDRYWYSYLRGAMDIWLPFRHEGPDRVIRILAHVGELPHSEYDGSPLDQFLEQLVEKEWAAVPGRPLVDLTAYRLKPLAEITTQFKELLFTEIDRTAVLAVVEQVIPALERRRDEGYEGPEEGTRDMMGALIGILRVPTQSTSR